MRVSTSVMCAAAGAAIGVALVACSQNTQNPRGAVASRDDALLATLMFDACGRWDPKMPRPVLPGPAPVITGLGDLHYPVTANREAQRFFDQGLMLAYAFNHCEAERAFLEAARRDPTCAMAHWGVAYVLGTNYNMPAAEVRNRAAYEQIQKALALSARVTPKERALIDAMAQRYSDPPPATEEAQLQLDQAYADAMKRVAEQYPDDPDVLTLYAEAWMNLRPWQLWSRDGRPAPHTLEIVAALERALELNANHTGANHLYIHTVEGSATPERAIPSADRLMTLAPSAGHLVHMPSHTYIRVGRYADAAEANRHAIEADRAYFKMANPDGVYPAAYGTHNYEFLWACLLMEGRKSEALEVAKKTQAHLDPVMLGLMPGLDSSLVGTHLTHVRFGDWQGVLREKAPRADQPYATAMAHWARTVAFARMGKLAEAERELAGVRQGYELLKDTPKGALRFNPDGPLMRIATLTAEAELDFARGDVEPALAKLREAATCEDNLIYSEPPDWPIPVRHRLGEALLELGRPQHAEMVFREDLERNRNNGWGLNGLAQSLAAQGRMSEADEVRRQLEQAWARADTRIAMAK